MNIPNVETAQIRFFDDVYRPCVERCMNIVSVRSMFEGLDHGTAVLNNETECDRYIACYGGHHFYKLRAAFDLTNFLYTDSKNIEIIDWGCGQALATCVLIDYFIQHRIKPNIMSITLIEPSSISLKRGCHFIKQMFQNNLSPQTILRVINQYIDDLNYGNLVSNQDNIKIHIFSNIIDVEVFSLEQLYRLMINSFKGLNRIICTSPGNHCKDRLDKFYELFSQSCQIKNSVTSNEPINGEVFYIKTRRYEIVKIDRYERQFSVNLP
ncbi:hypothetical protein LC593_22035 [Nostoc sp. CHAB 5844]|nr:hypothetical protein [Nostoc sp. CHAB 5844]